MVSDKGTFKCGRVLINTTAVCSTGIGTIGTDAARGMSGSVSPPTQGAHYVRAARGALLRCALLLAMSGDA